MLTVLRRLFDTSSNDATVGHGLFLSARYDTRRTVSYALQDRPGDRMLAVGHQRRDPEKPSEIRASDVVRRCDAPRFAHRAGACRETAGKGPVRMSPLRSPALCEPGSSVCWKPEGKHSGRYREGAFSAKHGARQAVRSDWYEAHGGNARETASTRLCAGSETTGTGVEAATGTVEKSRC